jgi:hypothetical protein
MDFGKIGFGNGITFRAHPKNGRQQMAERSAGVYATRRGEEMKTEELDG